MLTKKQSTRSLSAAGLRCGVVAARYNPELADALLANCVETLSNAREIKIVRVPGSFEISAAAGRLAKSGRYDCIIALGVLLQGQTRHAEHIGSAVSQGLTQISILTGVPTIFGVVTANNEKQARIRCVGKTYNRGREAALTAIEMAHVCKNL